jgi:hypothetical protein
MPHRVQIDGIDYAPAANTEKRHHSPWLLNKSFHPVSREGALWSEATSSDGHRRCRYCGQFVRDNGDLESHCCHGNDDAD